MKNKQAKCPLLALLLALVLLINLAVPVAGAAGAAQISFGQAYGRRGEQIAIPVTIKNNPGIASFRFRVAYDNGALTYVSAQKGTEMTGGTLSAAVDPDNGELAITWFDVKNYTGDDVLFNLVFEVSASAGGSYPLTVSYLPEDVVNASWQQVDVIVENGLVWMGQDVVGSIAELGVADNRATVLLMQEETEIARVETADGSYRFAAVPLGCYRLVVAVGGCEVVSCTVIVSEAEVVFCDRQLRGDVDADGDVDVADAIRILLYVTMPNDFSLDADADFDRNNHIDVSDAIRLLLHVTMPEDFPLM